MKHNQTMPAAPSPRAIDDQAAKQSEAAALLWEASELETAPEPSAPFAPTRSRLPRARFVTVYSARLRTVRWPNVPRTSRLAAGFVLSAWAVLAVSGLLYVGHFGLTSPYADEWRWTERVVGAKPVDATWLCQAENGHRVPLFKLVYLGVMRAGGYDFRSAAVLSVLLLAAASLGLLLAARRMRGYWAWTDVVLPALLLHWSQAINLVWGFQLFYVLSTALVLFFLVMVCYCGPRLPLPAGIVLAIILWCLPGCGGPGICCLPPLALWLAAAAVARCASGTAQQRFVGGLVCAAAVLSLASLPFYFSSALGGGSADSSIPPLHAWRATVSAVQVLAMGMGRLAEDLWPFSGAAVVVCAVFVGWRLMLVAWGDRPERMRALGLVAIMAAVILLAGGVGASRWHFGYDYCLTRRYITLSVPLLVALYLVAVRYGRLTLRPSAQLAAAVIVLVLLATYQRNGWRHAADLADRVDRLESQAAQGQPPATTAACCATDSHCERARLQECLELLRTAGIGPYRDVARASSP